MPPTCVDASLHVDSRVARRAQFPQPDARGARKPERPLPHVDSRATRGPRLPAPQSDSPTGASADPGRPSFHVDSRATRGTKASLLLGQTHRHEREIPNAHRFTRSVHHAGPRLRGSSDRRADPKSRPETPNAQLLHVDSRATRGPRLPPPQSDSHRQVRQAHPRERETPNAHGFTRSVRRTGPRLRGPSARRVRARNPDTHRFTRTGVHPRDQASCSSVRQPHRRESGSPSSANAMPRAPIVSRGLASNARGQASLLFGQPDPPGANARPEGRRFTWSVHQGRRIPVLLSWTVPTGAYPSAGSARRFTWSGEPDARASRSGYPARFGQSVPTGVDARAGRLAAFS
jgi:hypothetical protein